MPFPGPSGFRRHWPMTGSSRAGFRAQSPQRLPAARGRTTAWTWFPEALRVGRLSRRSAIAARANVELNDDLLGRCALLFQRFEGGLICISAAKECGTDRREEALDRAERVVHGAGFIPTVHHAVGALGIAAFSAVILPRRR